jgi:hypothetical protein
MMVAEKAADLILGDPPLSTEDIPYYRSADPRVAAGASHE